MNREQNRSMPDTQAKKTGVLNQVKSMQSEENGEDEAILAIKSAIAEKDDTPDDC